MNRTALDENNFVSEFRALPERREELVADLIRGAGRLTLNIPGRGPARRIAGRLREGPFTDYYEFEKLLARFLNPRLAALNLNIIADLLINGQFERKYERYGKQVQRIIASNSALSPDVLKGLILDMVANDGHYMVLKFHDLVLRQVDRALYRRLRPVEMAVLEMKKRLSTDAAQNVKIVAGAVRDFLKRNGTDAADILRERIVWDDELARFVRGAEEEEGPIIGQEDGPGVIPDEIDGSTEDAESFTGESGAYADTEPEEASASEDVILLDEMAAESDDDGGAEAAAEEEGKPYKTAGQPAGAPEQGEGGRIGRYADILKDDFLLKKRPDDEDAIRELVNGIYAKNEKRFGAERAVEIVEAVLSIWIVDESMDGWMRGILSDILDERSWTATVMEDQGDDDLAGETVASEPVHADNEDAAPVDEEGVSAEGTVTEGTQTTEAELAALLSDTEEVAPDQEPSPDPDAKSDQSILEEIERIDAADFVPVEDPSVAEVAADGEFLLSEEEFSALTKPDGAEGEGAGRDDGFLLESGEEPSDGHAGADHVDLDLEFDAGAAAGKRFSAQDGGDASMSGERPPSEGEEPEAESFIVQDELLFEDTSLKHKKQKGPEV
ncbi:MAG: hypothetical protein JXA07_08135 [Spirochaetes bacterium]|nr:hypothetical protein [Spirochaetota bacterium]